MLEEYTIVSIATAPGRGGVSIFRASGKESFPLARALTGKDKITPRYALRSNFVDPLSGEVIDDGLLIFFPGPNSFTGEDVVEFHCHGGRAVAELMMQAFMSFPGIRAAEAGEFSRRAFYNGKFDLTQLEAIADLVDAETRAQHRQALRQMDGSLSRLYERWRENLIRVCAYLEAFIDFPDEEIPDENIAVISHEIEALYGEINQHILDGHRGERLREGLRVAILGSPNSGKSSLINALVKREAAIVSPVAGTTRDVIEVHLDIGGYPVILADTAGLRQSEDIVEAEGIRRAYNKAKDADLKIVLIDAAQWPEIDPAIIELIDENTLILFNKIDIIKIPTEINISGHSALRVSVKQGDGMSKFMSEFEREVRNRLDTQGDPVLTRSRHRQALTETLNYLERAKMGNELELIAEDLRMAARWLGKITGKVDVEDLLDVIFRDFCIGK